MSRRDGFQHRLAGRSAGFSLVELVAVLALSAILISIGSLAFAQWRASADMTDAEQRVGSADALLRQQAQANGNALWLRLDRGAMSRATPDGPATLLSRLPADVRIDQVLPDSAADGDGLAHIAISPAGRSRSYAVLLVGSDDRRQWIGIAGLSGQIVKLDDAEQAEQLVGDSDSSADAH